MRILITGGAGFLGSHLSDMLLQAGHSVICMDNLLTGRVENIAHLLGHERFSFVKYNVCDYVHVDGLLDVVMHFASPASPQDYLEYPIATLKVGALGTHKVLGLAKAKGARFLLASTSEVYGDPLVNPQPESYWGNVNPLSPRGVYDEAKRFAEALTMAYHRYHAVDTRIVRIFNTFGPRMRTNDGRVVSTFIVQALHGKPLSVFGDGSQTRSFCYVDDLVRGITGLLFLDSDRNVEQRTDRKFLVTQNKGAADSSMHDPVNIGKARDLTVLENAKLVLKFTSSSSQIPHQPL
ncbi:MAG TPA: NAD-dependent epimerase/dehydratase family protein, partial [Nitrospiraceae bacterium]|nr:NAD-dependent epimerase/dehydratase family protein [Nitrospiraceae bacterium]